MGTETEARYAPGSKVHVLDDTPKSIKELQFGVFSGQDVINQSEVELADRRLFDLDKNPKVRTYQEYGPLDMRLGVSGKRDQCKTCGQRLQDCNGHFGHVKLVLPVFHIGYFKRTIQILQSICKDCSAILLSEADRRKYIAILKRHDKDHLRYGNTVRKIAEQCRKTKTCFECGAINGLVRKAGSGALKIAHDKFKAFNSSIAAKKVAPLEKITYDESFSFARKSNADLEKHVKKAVDDLNPMRTLKLLRRISQADRELLGLRSVPPEAFLWQQVPVPPVSIRPSVGQEGSSTEDDLTAKMGDIIQANNDLRNALQRGTAVPMLIELWDHLSLQLAMYINSDVPGLVKGDYSKPIRGLVQRLKGKQGRFRGNLSGKRVDFTGRTVISPDPNLRIDEVAIPVLVARNMTYPEIVTRHNREKLQERVRNGTSVWPGANYVSKKSQGKIKIFLKFGNRMHIASSLQYGDIVERHLEDGDIVLFNRQPSLHKLSILSHYVRVRPHRTFRLNECVCTPYNADFDGDEMNLHVPQTEEARTEAVQLMGVKRNLVTPKNGEPIISAIQDFVTASFLLSSLDQFYDKKTFVNICCGMLEDDTKFDLPPPAILKPEALWTGKQVFNILMRPNKKLNVTVNLDAACRDHEQYHAGMHRDLQDDSFLCIRNSEMMCGRMDKSTVGSGKKNSIFYVLYRDFGPDAAASSMNRLSKLCARWLGDQGFSVGINDVTPTEVLTQVKRDLIDDVFKQCSKFTADSKAGKLKRKAGLDDAGTLEAEQIRVLSTVRTKVAKALSSQLSKHNAPMIMAMSGSKGSSVNVAQMAALLGQQDIEGKRVPEGFQDRTLPHFLKHVHSPPSKGFVSNSFFSGLLPYEFIFHAMGGRIGLVDTAVKTAETGYMSRRLMKSLEDLSSQYDRTVRNSMSDIVQFRFGDDELDPVDMEASAKPVDFERTYTHVDATTFDLKDKGLWVADVKTILNDILDKEKQALARKSLDGNPLPYFSLDDSLVDQHESQRAFVQSIHDFVISKIEQFGAIPDEANSGLADAMTGTTRRSGRRSTAATAKNSKKSKGSQSLATTTSRYEMTSKLSKRTLAAFVKMCLAKYEQARTEPGHAVGAIGAQSIGEPGTQMTLKTFHFAGVAGMSLTAGVPRIKEIINASKEISTPVITCKLERRRDLSIPEDFARIVKGRIEALYLEDVTSYIQISHSLDRPSCLYVKISLDTIMELGLELTIDDICLAIQRHRRFRGAGLRIQVRGKDEIKLSTERAMKSGKRGAAAKQEESSHTERLLRLQLLRRFLPTIQILGHPMATRAVVIAEDDPMSDAIKAKRAELEPPRPAPVPAEAMDAGIKQEGTLHSKKTKRRKSNTNKEPTIKIEEDGPTVPSPAPTPKSPTDKPVQMHKLLVSGYGLRACLSTPGINPASTTTNTIIETFQVLGIEAARSTIIAEIQAVTRDLSIDPRHMYLLADVMTYKGEVLGITRFGLAKMSSSVLQLASFEKTADHVFEAAWSQRRDGVKGVSESVIVGKAMSVGTGGVKVVRRTNMREGQCVRRKTVFDDAWTESER